MQYLQIPIRQCKKETSSQLWVPLNNHLICIITMFYHKTTQNLLYFYQSQTTQVPHKNSLILYSQKVANNRLQQIPILESQAQL